ncbi:MAG: DUF1772 domain-containing protein [Granulosicoccus sp.]
MTILLTIASISAGLMAGVYFAFSTFIMRSLHQLGPTRAADAMNSINDVILRSWFMLLFFGSTLLYLVLLVVGIVSTELTGRWFLILSGLIYVVGMFCCTAMFNVPLNNRLAQTRDEQSRKVEIWAIYFKKWTRWNHLRGTCSLITMVLSMHYLVNYA